jgi:hypothetical protein
MFNLLGIFFQPAKTKPNNSPPPCHWYLKDVEKKAVVDEAIDEHNGRARFRDSIWPARCVENVTLEPEQVCEVLDIDNITLIVKPISRN